MMEMRANERSKFGGKRFPHQNLEQQTAAQIQNYQTNPFVIFWKSPQMNRLQKFSISAQQKRTHLIPFNHDQIRLNPTKSGLKKEMFFTGTNWFTVCLCVAGYCFCQNLTGQTAGPLRL